jgi:hypothetical protein
MFKLVVSAVTLFLGVVALTCSVDSALADRRVALVVGNATYKNNSLHLPNPKNDAQDVAAALRKLDFEVIQATDADKREFEMALQRFARAAVDADSALFFYAGHAMQYQGRNYLMPVDAELEDEFSLRYQMVLIDDVRAALDRVNGVKIMILDACRNNPLAEQLARRQTGFTRALGRSRGLARIDKTQGMVVAYATAADDVAADGNGRNSPFTQALLKRLQEPGLEIEQMFRAIARDVYSQTGGKQRPETYISLLSEYYLNQADRLAWEKIKDSGDVAALRDFIARFPSSIRALDARYRLEMLERFAREREIERQRYEREVQARLEAEERVRLSLAERQRQDREEAARRKAEEEARIAEMARLRDEREQAQRQEAEERARLAETERLRKLREAEEKKLLAEAERQRKEREGADRREAQERAKLALAERQRQEREAEERRKVEERARIAENERLRKEREAAAKREAEERVRLAAAERVRKQREEAERRQAEEQARLAEAERVRREQQAAERRKAEELARIADAERLRKQQEADANRDQAERDRLAAADRNKLEQVCRQEDERLALLQAAGNGAREELIRFERELSCERLRPVALASLGNMPTEVPPQSGSPTGTPTVATRPPEPANVTPMPEERPAVNTIELVTAAQTELKRLGCLPASASADGIIGDRTTDALKKYLSERDLPDDNLDVTDDVVKDMKAQGERVCEIECGRNQVLRGDKCVAAPRKSTPVARREEPSRPAARHRREPRESRPARVAVQPTVRQQPAASARPAPKVLGVGF